MRLAFGAELLLVASLAATGCRKEAGVSQPTADAAVPSTTASAPPADPANQAKRYFKTKCVVCHGERGKGDGPGASALTPKPRDYTDAAWQRSVSDEQLKKTIVNGGAAVGKSAAMPANPDLRDKPALVDELVKLIRGFGG